MAFIGGTVAMALIGCGSIVALEIARPGGDWNSQATYSLIGMLGPIFAVMLAGLRSHVQAESVKQEVTAKIENTERQLDHIHACVETKTADAAQAAKEAAIVAKEAVVTAKETKHEIIEAITNGGSTPKEIKAEITVHGDKP